MHRVKFIIEECYIKGLTRDCKYKINQDYLSTKNPGKSPVLHYRWANKVLLFDVCVSETLFGNSFEEHNEQDINQFADCVRRYAKRKYHLAFSNQDVKNAQCWYLEYGKNIVLPVKYNQEVLLQQIGRCLAKGAQTLTNVKYYSSVGSFGREVALYTQSYEQSFYNKTAKELFIGCKQNKTLFAVLLKKGHQVLRFEVKFFKHRFIHAALTKFKPGIHTFTLQDVWNLQLEKDYLLFKWKQIAGTIHYGSYSSASLEKAIYQAIQMNVPLKDIIYKVGLMELHKKFGATGLKRILCPTLLNPQTQKNTNQFATVKKQSQRLRGLFPYQKTYIVQRVSDTLERFIPIRITSHGIVGAL